MHAMLTVHQHSLEFTVPCTTHALATDWLHNNSCMQNLGPLLDILHVFFPGICTYCNIRNEGTYRLAEAPLQKSSRIIDDVILHWCLRNNLVLLYHSEIPENAN